MEIDGTGFVPVKKCTYISAIRLENKAMDKDLKEAMKPAITKIKKSKKTDYVSANGVRVGGSPDDPDDRYDFSIAAYPMYAGNYRDEANNWGEVRKIMQRNYNTVDVMNGTRGMGIQTVEYYDGASTKTIIEKGGSIKKIRMTVQLSNEKYKNLTLKPSYGEKRNGLKTDKGTECSLLPGVEVFFNEWKDLFGSKIYKIETNGNYFGYIVYPEHIPTNAERR